MPEKGRKLSPICPASDPDNTHSLSLKSLVAVNFSEDPQDKTKDGSPLRICPSCKKALNNHVKSYCISFVFYTHFSGPGMWTCNLQDLYGFIEGVGRLFRV
jgi:hypothetical protein